MPELKNIHSVLLSLGFLLYTTRTASLPLRATTRTKQDRSWHPGDAWMFRAAPGGARAPQHSSDSGPLGSFSFALGKWEARSLVPHCPQSSPSLEGGNVCPKPH